MKDILGGRKGRASTSILALDSGNQIAWKWVRVLGRSFAISESIGACVQLHWRVVIAGGRSGKSSGVKRLFQVSMCVMVGGMFFKKHSGRDCWQILVNV
jgi:hypothetical protein